MVELYLLPTLRALVAYKGGNLYLGSTRVRCNMPVTVTSETCRKRYAPHVHSSCHPKIYLIYYESTENFRSPCISCSIRFVIACD
jgi:hypothetical protein